MRIAMTTLFFFIFCLKTFGGDGTLPPKYQFFNSATFEADSVLVLPHYFHDNQIIDELIHEFHRYGFQIYMPANEREELNDSILTIPISSVGITRDDIMPTFVRNAMTHQWSIIEGSNGVVSKEISSWFAQYFDIPVISKREYDIKNKLLIDHRNNCLTVEQNITDRELEDLFGCREIIRFVCRSSHCHINDHVVLLKNETVVTTQHAFKLKMLGYRKVYFVPRVGKDSPTDVLILGDHLFLLYDQKNWSVMSRVQKIYEKIGYQVHAIGSKKPLCFGINSITSAIPALFKPTIF